MTKHLLAADLVKLGWETSVAEAAEDALRELSEQREPLDAQAEAASAYELAVDAFATEETANVLRLDATDVTSGRILLSRR
jgi:hypothetical protein